MNDSAKLSKAVGGRFHRGVEAGLRLEASGVSCCAVGVVGAPMCVAAPGIYVFHAYQANDSAQWKRKVQADKRVMTKQPYRLYALWLKVT